MERAENYRQPPSIDTIAQNELHLFMPSAVISFDKPIKVEANLSN